MTLTSAAGRLGDRQGLLSQLDRLRRDIDNGGQMEGFDAFETQAFNLLLGNAADAFDVTKEPASVQRRYGRRVGKYLLTARRLCEASVLERGQSAAGMPVVGNMSFISFLFKSFVSVG